MKYTDATRSVIDMSDGRFVPVDQLNMDYLDVLARVAAGAEIEKPDAPPLPAEALSAVERALIEKGVLTKEEIAAHSSGKVAAK